MLAAWQGIGGFAEERASLRTWLYTIATRRCLNARRAAARRPATAWDMSRFEPPVPTPREEAVWLQPFPDALLQGAAGRPPGPEALAGGQICAITRFEANVLPWFGLPRSLPSR
jgi:DNA-directed RNA polymerase specialized sigma24 family protein